MDVNTPTYGVTSTTDTLFGGSLRFAAPLRIHDATLACP